MKHLIFLLVFFTSYVHATLNDVEKQNFFAKNLLTNGGFENGKAGISKTGSGTMSLSTTSANVISGKVSLDWDPSAADEYLNIGTSTYYRWDRQAGKNGVAVCSLKGAYSEYTMQIYDGTNVIAEQVLSSASTSAQTQKYYLNFVFPTTEADGSVSATLRLKSTANAVSVKVDDCWLGDASEINLTNVSQAQFIGSAYIATTANCQPTRANTALGALGDDTDCPGPTVESNPGPGTIQTTDTDNLDFTVNNLPPGVYRIDAYIPGYQSSSSNSACFAISDGTTTSPGVCNSGFTEGLWTVTHNFTYTAAGNRTFSIYAASSAGTIGVYNTTALRNTKITIHRFPLSTEQAYRPDVMASSWSGYHGNTCSWARTNTAFGDPTADATCAFSEITNQNFGTVASYTSGGNNLPGIVFTPKRAGKYFVCAHFYMDSSATTGKNILVDGSVTIATGGNPGSTIPIHNMLCGIVTASSTSSKTVAIQTASTSGSTTVGSASYARSIDWNIFAIDQQLPAPLLVNSVTNTSTGVSGIEAAELNCDSGSSIVRQQGSWVSSIGNISAGACTVTLSAGVFSATPYCWSDLVNVSNPDGVLGTDPTSSTSVTVDCDDAGSATDCTSYDFQLFCIGPK